MNPLVERVMGPMLTVHQWLYEHSDGRIGASLGGRPMLLLRTVGRRTSQPRTSALLYVRDGDPYVVIASGWRARAAGVVPQPHRPARRGDPSRPRADPGPRPGRKGRGALPTLGARRRDQPGPVRHVPVPHESRVIPVVVLEPR